MQQNQWFELLKRARTEKETREKLATAASDRSAEGSVELFEMMKRAKASFWASRVDQISFRSQVILDNLFGPGIGIGDIV